MPRTKKQFNYVGGVDQNELAQHLRRKFPKQVTTILRSQANAVRRSQQAWGAHKPSAAVSNSKARQASEEHNISRGYRGYNARVRATMTPHASNKSNGRPSGKPPTPPPAHLKPSLVNSNGRPSGKPPTPPPAHLKPRLVNSNGRPAGKPRRSTRKVPIRKAPSPPRSAAASSTRKAASPPRSAAAAEKKTKKKGTIGRAAGKLFGKKKK
jgi:hypothetical protein